LKIVFVFSNTLPVHLGIYSLLNHSLIRNRVACMGLGWCSFGNLLVAKQIGWYVGFIYMENLVHVSGWRANRFAW